MPSKPSNQPPGGSSKLIYRIQWTNDPLDCAFQATIAVLQRALDATRQIVLYHSAPAATDPAAAVTFLGCLRLTLELLLHLPGASRWDNAGGTPTEDWEEALPYSWDCGGEMLQPSSTDLSKWEALATGQILPAIERLINRRETSGSLDALLSPTCCTASSGLFPAAVLEEPPPTQHSTSPTSTASCLPHVHRCLIWSAMDLASVILISRIGEVMGNSRMTR